MKSAFIELFKPLLRFPLFYKVLTANVVLVILGVMTGLFISSRLNGKTIHMTWFLPLLFACMAISVTILINILLLRAAFKPIRELRRTVLLLDDGNYAARVPESIYADSDLSSVADTINMMLERLQRYQERAQELSASVLNAQEGERQRISRELHDQIGQSMTLLLIRLKLLENESEFSNLQRQITEIRVAVAETIDQVRRLAQDLRPPALDQLGLCAAIQTLTREFAERTGIATRCEVPAEQVQVSAECAAAIYRIAQEALTNIAKHAEAASAHIVIKQTAENVTVTISDNGRGFNAANFTDKTNTLSGLGLFGMEERARLLGGVFLIESSPGAGAVVTATIPKVLVENVHGSTYTAARAD